MKRILAIWVALSLTFYIVFNLTISWEAYLSRLQTIPSPLHMFTDFVNSCKQVGVFFSTVHNFGDVLKAIAKIFEAIWSFFRLPFFLLNYVIEVIMIILPIGVIS